LRFFSAIGHALIEFFAYTGAIMRMSLRFFKVLFKTRLSWPEFISQCEIIGLRSVPIATLILFFVGLVFAFQFGLSMKTMGAIPYLGKITSLSIARELGPVFTALVVGGRVGAGMAAELGSMKVTEQIDAIRSLGADPDNKLLVPRVLAATLMLPIITLIADIAGFFGGMLIGWSEFGLSPLAYYASSISTVYLSDFLSGFFKPFFFGFFIAIIGCYQGFQTRGGTAGVGDSTTRTVVIVSMMVVFVDFFLTRIFALMPSF
tara:strand:+ start:1304 stop:2086 length:783 start_codon:yes stop_codon:yes gene_type:complete